MSSKQVGLSRGEARSISASTVSRALDSDEDGDEDVFEDAQETWSSGTRPPSIASVSSLPLQQGRPPSSSYPGQPTYIKPPPVPPKTAITVARKETKGNSTEIEHASAHADGVSTFYDPYPPFNPYDTQRLLGRDTTTGTSEQTLSAVPITARSISVRSNAAASTAPTRSRASSVGDGNDDDQTRYDKVCEACTKQFRALSYCNVCKCSFCDTCWDAQFLHRRKGKGPGGIPHEKTDPMVAEKVQKVLSPEIDEWTREQLYRADEVTSWFGVERPDDLGPPSFQDYGRFSELMVSTDPVRNNPKNVSAFLEDAAALGKDLRTPSLVSFVGQTGAGKSTLVKLLIDLGLRYQENYSTPVIGTSGAHLPTSEDVHLYMDPRTAESEGPLLYADCEGLEGGEREPLGAKFRRQRRGEQQKEDKAAKAVKNVKVISEWELKWANGPRERSREFAVTNLYPRLLYTFSDVIVFVLRNPRTIEHVFERLIIWAVAAIETSSNQPVLPHAIIALNLTEHDIDEKLWNVKANTESVLDDLAHTVNRNVTFKKWAQYWRERGKKIDTLTDLILCYYNTVQILRIPQDGRPNLMQQQIEMLYQSTLVACIAARSKRYHLRMLLNVEELQAYLQQAFGHYSSTLESPFDFVQASFKNSPIPSDFGGNILKMALNMMDIAGDQVKIDARRIFSELSYMVASCIMLDSARSKSKGYALQIFPEYMGYLDDALENFCDHHWPCEFVDSKKQKCVNVRVGHQSKGHQAKNGKVIAAGDYESTFSFHENYEEFRDEVYCCLVQLLAELASRVEGSAVEETAAAAIHKTYVLTSFFRHTKSRKNNSGGGSTLQSQTACFCCLFGRAEHALRCGHVLCTACVINYGKARNSNEIDIHGCPMECMEQMYYTPLTVYLKPKSAGVRILTLDGGGIRGIVELEVLKQIERHMGGNIPVQCFFDLIVGTSTGGIIALGIASMGWRVDTCIQHFEKLCLQAFTRRTGSSFPLLGTLVENYHHSRYQTTTLESALKAVFTDDCYLFGGTCPSDVYNSSVKVAITTTLLAGNKAYLLSNYNRLNDEEFPSNYHFQRPERLSHELKVWEAARATSAAPRYFKSFHHEPSQKTYVDGAVFHNNPVRVADAERRALWPDQEVPDIFLSIGTGSSIILERATSQRMSAAKKGFVSHGINLYNILRNNMQAALDCDRAWNDYFASVTGMLRLTRATSRFIRINPALEGEVPELDEKAKMGEVRRSARDALLRDPAIPRLAQQLIATVFYFEMLSPIAEGEDSLNGYLIRGKILCRLKQPSAEVAELGRYFRKRQLEDGEIQFLIGEETSQGKPLQQKVWSHSSLETMIHDQKFEMGRVTFRIRSKAVPTRIDLCFGSATSFPISGFPRLLTSDFGTANARKITSHSYLRTPRGLHNQASQRYTRGSRRKRKLVNKWEPPDLQGRPSLTNLRQYTDPDRAMGSDVIERQMRTDMEHMGNVPPETVSVLQKREEQQRQKSSKKSAVRNAFRGLFWPVQSTQEPGSEPEPTYYHVNAEDNAIYQRWIRLLGPVMGRNVLAGEAYAQSASGMYELATTGSEPEPVEIFEMPAHPTHYLAELP